VSDPPSKLLICCGAIAREVMCIVRDHGWDNIRVQCLAPILHNDPPKILEGVREKIRDNRDRFDRLLVLYGDCGTGGRMQALLDAEGVEGIGGAHCYEAFAGEAYSQLMAQEPGTFFLTDFLARHFERLVFTGLGLDRFPKLRDAYFGRYKKMVYLAQTKDPALEERARAAADSIGLELEIRHTGLGNYERFLQTRQAPGGT
jgi:hypothetical protein